MTKDDPPSPEKAARDFIYNVVEASQIASDFNVEPFLSCTSPQCAAEQLLSDSEWASELSQAGTRAKEAHENVEKQFLHIIKLLSEAKLQHKDLDMSQFEEQFMVFEEKFRNLIKTSLTDANSAGTFATRVGDILIPMCNDSSIPIGERMEKLKIYLTATANYLMHADRISEEFHSLITNCAQLQGQANFPAWKTKEEDIRNDIARAQNRMKAAHGRSEELDGNIFDWAIGFGACVILLVVLSCVAYCRKHSSRLLQVLIGISGSNMVGSGYNLVKFHVEKEVNQTTLRTETDRKFTLEGTLERLRKEQQVLIKRLEESCCIIQGDLKVFKSLWQSFYNDLQHIEQWLKEGADINCRPAYMQCSVEHVTKSYNKLGQYLQGYVKALS
ncbi:hypothetical protein BDZ91DRAFT_853236 [Kalaharituber pfeilii]|nr:hypothetical protein BDZ91DRAFT_853236 [Kalaharituber pfeilii]